MLLTPGSCLARAYCPAPPFGGSCSGCGEDCAARLCVWGAQCKPYWAIRQRHVRPMDMVGQKGLRFGEFLIDRGVCLEDGPGVVV